MVSNFLYKTIRETHRSLLNGEVTVTQLQKESYKIIKQCEILNPFITVCQEETLHKAQKLDIQLETDHSNYKLHTNELLGIPISIKDNFCTNQILTTCASKMLHNFVPNYNATAVAKLMDANCLMMGKTNMDEFAMGSSSVSSYYGPTAKCWPMNENDELKRSKPQTIANDNQQIANDEISDDGRLSWFMAGGSSTGSAVSVSSGACYASLGTDTGGSTRQPASLTGIVGFKPTYGLVSRFGLIPLAHCLDVISVLARTVDDVKCVFETIIGRDENDLTSVDHKRALKVRFDSERFINNQSKIKLRIGVPDDFISNGVVTTEVIGRFQEILNNLANTQSRSSQAIEVSFELIKLNLNWSRFATECYTIISSSEIASNMSCYDGVRYGHSSSSLSSQQPFDRDQFFMANRDEGFGSEVKKRILLGNYFLLSENREKYLVQATRLRRCINNEFERAFSEQQVDFIVTPSTPSTSHSYRDWLIKEHENKLFHEDYFLIPSNLANLPSISIPAGRSKLPSNQPIGLQLIGNKYHDLDLLFVADWFERKILNEFC